MAARCCYCGHQATRIEPFGGKPACTPCWEQICFGDPVDEAEQRRIHAERQAAEAARIAALPPATPEMLARIAARRANRKRA